MVGTVDEDCRRGRMLYSQKACGITAGLCRGTLQQNEDADLSVRGTNTGQAICSSQSQCLEASAHDCHQAHGLREALSAP